MRELRVRLYYWNGKQKVIIKTFGDGTNVSAALHESRLWCIENCKEKGIMEYYYNGNRVWCEQCL